MVWIKRHIFFHDKRHPRDLDKVGALLGALAVERKVNARKPGRVPSILTRAEVSGLLGAIDDPDAALPFRSLNGAGSGFLSACVCT